MKASDGFLCTPYGIKMRADTPADEWFATYHECRFHLHRFSELIYIQLARTNSDIFVVDLFFFAQRP
jgi:hypothetical protein